MELPFDELALYTRLRADHRERAQETADLQAAADRAAAEAAGKLSAMNAARGLG